MKDEDKRKKFEEAKWVVNKVDLMPENPKADKSCESCRGHGVVDEGHLTGCILSNCPDCWI